MIVIAITGASGVIYGIRLLEVLKELNIENSLVISDAAKTVIESETEYKIDEIIDIADEYYDFNDLTSSINSGSFKADALAIVPCSMKTLSSIANGYGDNTITRVADVSLKERRPTVIVPRETPLRSIHLQNMLTLSQEGAIILPAMPGFYSAHDTVDDQINFIVGKILDSLKIENNLFKRWEWMLEDMDFIKSCDVPGPTKEAIRAIILYKSEVSSKDKVVDCGCGTGGITCEFSQRANEVISIDTNPEAIEITEKNLKKFGLGDNVTLINDNGANALKDIDNIDIAIVGGSGRELENILNIIDAKLNSKGRIIITAILVDTKIEAINKLKELNYNPKLMEVNISNGRVLDRGVMMISENPIAIITAKKR